MPRKQSTAVFGGLIASGWHTCAVGMRLMCEGTINQTVSLGSPGIDNIRWLKPVRAGDTLAYRRIVVESRASATRKGVGLVKHRWEAVNQHGELVLTMEGWGLFGRKIDLKHKVHVLTKKEELDSVRMPGKVVIVLDILFATTTMVTALAHGAKEVVPVFDEAAARLKRSRSSQRLVRTCRRALCRDAARLRAPRSARAARARHRRQDAHLLHDQRHGGDDAAARAARVYCGALLNARRLAEHIVAQHARDTVLIACSGSGSNFNFEDFYGAGYFVECFLPHVRRSIRCGEGCACALPACPGAGGAARLPRRPHDGGARARA